MLESTSVLLVLAEPINQHIFARNIFGPVAFRCYQLELVLAHLQCLPDDGPIAVIVRCVDAGARMQWLL